MVLVEPLKKPDQNHEQVIAPAEQAGIFLQGPQHDISTLVSVGKPMRPLIEVLNPIQAVEKLGSYVMELQRKYGGQGIVIIPCPDGTLSFYTSEKGWDIWLDGEAQRVEEELKKLHG